MQEVLDLWPNSGTARVADVAALAERWQRRWPSARHASPAASLTVANMRHLLLDALWRKLPVVTEAEQHDRAVTCLHPKLLKRMCNFPAMPPVATHYDSIPWSFHASRADSARLPTSSTLLCMSTLSGYAANTYMVATQAVGRMKADTILRGAAALVSQGFPDTAENLLQHHRDLTDDTAPVAALRARLSVYNSQARGFALHPVPSSLPLPSLSLVSFCVPGTCSQPFRVLQANRNMH